MQVQTTSPIVSPPSRREGRTSDPPDPSRIIYATSMTFMSLPSTTPSSASAPPTRTRRAVPWHRAWWFEAALFVVFAAGLLIFVGHMALEPALEGMAVLTLEIENFHSPIVKGSRRH